MGFFSSIGDALSGAVGSIIGAGASLLGVNKNSKATSDANAANIAFAREQLEYQKELARNQIQWKVEDAKKAGLHPLAGLGVSPSSYSPVSGGVIPNTQDYSYLQQMGQDIDRSILQAKTKEEQRAAMNLQNESIRLDLRGKDLNNQILEMELASKRSRLAQQLQPAVPSVSMRPDGSLQAIPGQAQSDVPLRKGSIELKPAEVVANELGHPSQVAGSNPDYSFQRLPGGGYAPTRMVNGQDPYEEDFLGGIAWNVRNRLLSGFSVTDGRNAPPASWLPDRGKGGYEWLWNWPNMAWYPHKKDSSLFRSYFRKYYRHYFPR